MSNFFSGFNITNPKAFGYNQSNDQSISNFVSNGGIITVKQSVHNILDILKDNWDRIINSALCEQFTIKKQQKLRHLKTKELNVLKSIVNETAMLYKKPATRKAVLGKEVSESGTVTIKGDEVYEDILKDIPIDQTMMAVDRMNKATNQTVLKIVWRNGKIDYDILTFDNVEIETDPDDWKEIIKYTYFVGLGLPDFDDENSDEGVTDVKGIKKQKFVTKFVWEIIKERNKDGSIKRDSLDRPLKPTSVVKKFRMNNNGEPVLVDTRPNPYKDQSGMPVLPFVLFHRAFPAMELLDFTTGGDMIDNTINTAMNMIHLNQLMKYQSYKQVVISHGERTKMPQPLSIGPSDILDLPTSDGETTTATALDIQTAIDNYLEVIQKRVAMIMGTYGIPSSRFRISGNAESGIKIKLDNFVLVERREADAQLFRIGEKELFEKTRVVNNFHNTKQINEKAEFFIDYGEIDLPANEEEQAKADTINITNNVKSPIDVIMDQDPDLSREQATAKYLEIKTINSADIMGVQPEPVRQPVGVNVPPTEPESQADQNASQ